MRVPSSERRPVSRYTCNPSRLLSTAVKPNCASVWTPKGQVNHVTCRLDMWTAIVQFVALKMKQKKQMYILSDLVVVSFYLSVCLSSSSQGHCEIVRRRRRVKGL